MKFLVFAFFVVQVNALIEWPFYWGNGRENILKLSVGNPPQSLTVSMFDSRGQMSMLDQNYPGLYLLSPNENGQHFRLNESTTFTKIKEYIGVHDESIGFFGLEDFVIKSAKSVTLKQLPVKVFDYKYGQRGYLSLMRSQDGNTFLEKILEKENEQVVVVIIDKQPKNENKRSTGKLLLGGRPENCVNWTYVPEVKIKEGNHWSFVVDSLKIGGQTVVKPMNASIRLDDMYFEFPQDIYDKVRRELGVTDQNYIHCNQKEKIALTVGGKEMSIGPDSYIYKSEFDFEINSGEDQSKRCSFNGNPGYRPDGSNEVILPRDILHNQCLLLDFKLKRIGFADKVKLNRL